MNVLKGFIKMIATILIILVTLYVVVYMYYNFFVTKIYFLNNSQYISYASKGEYDIKNVDPTHEEASKEISAKIEPHAKTVFSVMNTSFFSKNPINIYLGWHTTVKNHDGDLVFPHQSRRFYFSDKGFCEYEITLYDDNVEIKGINKNYCYKKIIIDLGFKL